MNLNKLKTNRGLLALIIGLGVAATAGVSVVYAQTSSDSTQNQAPQIQGSIDLQNIIKSEVKTSFIDAAKIASSAVTNGNVIGGNLTIIQGSVVYQFIVMDDANMIYSVIVDAGNGQILITSAGHQMKFGGFGMFGHGMGEKFGHMGGYGWQKQVMPSDSSSGTSSPTSHLTKSLTESQV